MEQEASGYSSNENVVHTRTTIEGLRVVDEGSTQVDLEGSYDEH